MTWLNWLCRISGLKIRFVWNVFQNSGEDLYLINSLSLKSLIQTKTSKDWSQSLYWRINSYEPLLDRQVLKSVLQKCLFIKKIDLKYEIDSQVLSLIGRYCHNIKSLSIFSSDVKILDFGRHYGHKLEEFFLYANNEETKEFLAFCPNLKIIRIFNESDLYNTDENFFTEIAIH